MATPKCVEVFTLQQCVDTLATGISIDPVIHANKLLEKGLTSRRLVREMLNPSKDKYDKATELVMEVMNIVENSPEKFQVFMDILREFMYLEDVVKLVHSQYEENNIANSKDSKVKVLKYIL